jgi:hypothetical protein
MALARTFCSGSVNAIIDILPSSLCVHISTQEMSLGEKHQARVDMKCGKVTLGTLYKTIRYRVLTHLRTERITVTVLVFRWGKGVPGPNIGWDPGNRGWDFRGFYSQMQGEYLSDTTIASFQILSNPSLMFYHSTVHNLDTCSIVKNPQKIWNYSVEVLYPVGVYI